MKKLLTGILSITFSWFVFSCSKTTESADTEYSDETTTEAIAEEESAAEESEVKAVSIWDKVSVRESPNEKGKWVTSLSLGEALTYLKESKMDGDKEYYKVRLQDGKEGWSRSVFIATEAKAATFKNDTDIYSRPDLLTKTDKKFSKMDIVAIGEEKDGWVEVKGKRSEGKWIDKGWIKTNNLSDKPVDIATAKFAKKALSLEDKAKRVEALKEIVTNSDLSNSTFIPEISEMATELQMDEEEVVDEIIEELEETTEADSI